MELSQKKTNATFKQLDGTLRTYDERTNERVTLSHKCSELDKQVPSLFGISKSILDYVLFCHQEDSSWPLMEGSVLKKRFDDIFDSTRYTKAVRDCLVETAISQVSRLSHQNFGISFARGQHSATHTQTHDICLHVPFFLSVFL